MLEPRRVPRESNTVVRRALQGRHPRHPASSSTSSSRRSPTATARELDAWHARVHASARSARSSMRARARAASRSTTDALTRARHRDQPLHHRADRRASSGIEHLIATDIEEVDGALHRQAARHAVVPRGQGRTACASGSPRAASALEDFESWFYSDSLNDLPLLELRRPSGGGRSRRHAARAGARNAAGR